MCQNIRPLPPAFSNRYFLLLNQTEIKIIHMQTSVSNEKQIQCEDVNVAPIHNYVYTPLRHIAKASTAVLC